MAAPSLYDETTLAAYMDALLGATATALGWSVVGSDYDEPVNDALLAYGVDDISDATNIEKLRAAARLAVWRAVAAVTAANYRFRTGEQSFDRQQIHEQAVEMELHARTDAMRYGIAYSLVHKPIYHRHDPYVYRTDAERTVP